MTKYLIAAAIVAALYFAFAKAKAEPVNTEGSNPPAPAPEEGQAGALRAAFALVVEKYGKAAARDVERLFRLETDNFKSGQWNACLSPGMGSAAPDRPRSFPFGWGSLRQFADSFPAYGLGPATMSTVTFTENVQPGAPNPATIPFVKFPAIVPSVHFVAFFLDKKGEGPGRWKSTDPAQQEKYRLALQRFGTPIVDSL